MAGSRARAKWSASTAEGKQWTFGLRSGLGLVEAAPAGEDDVGAGQEPVLGVDQAGGGVLEQGELVHAVVDDDLPGPEAVAVGGEHGRVEPADQRPVAADGGDVGLDQGAEVEVGVGAAVGPQDGDAGGDVEGVEPGGPVVEEGLLLDDHRGVAGEPAEQVLRALIDPIPAEVAMANEEGGGVIPGVISRSWQFPYRMLEKQDINRAVGPHDPGGTCADPEAFACIRREAGPFTACGAEASTGLRDCKPTTDITNLTNSNAAIDGAFRRVPRPFSPGHPPRCDGESK